MTAPATRHYRYIRHALVPDAELLGYLPTRALEGTVHGLYSRLCLWPATERCACGRNMPVPQEAV